MKDKTYMVFDVESLGLHGEGFSVGYVVVGNGLEIESGYFRAHPDNANGADGDREWIAKNVLPVMDSGPVAALNDGPGSKSCHEVRDAFWSRWMAWKANGAILCADCLWPVEARFLIDCVNDDPSRNWDGPYPFIDIASVRLAAGLDPLGTNERQAGETPVHHPLADARQSARLLIEALEETSRVVN